MFFSSLSKKKIKEICVFLYAFLIFYMPRIFELVLNINFHIFTHIIVFVILLILVYKKIVYITLNKNRILINKTIFNLIFGIFLSTLYFCIIALINNSDTRIMQNNFIIIQVISLLFIIDILKSIGYKKDDFILFLLRLGTVQGIICILMLLIPDFRNLALQLYYLGKEDSININLINKRIYGVSGDYTYFTPIYHGILCTVACIYSLFRGKKYLIYVPFILFSIVLNGRTGIFLFIITISLFYFTLFFNPKYIVKSFKYIFFTSMVIFVGIWLTKSFSHNTYIWIISAINDTLNLFFNRTLTGNYDILFNDMLFFPKGMGILFGEGHRVYGVDAINRNISGSDIGYVNDIFMGGIIYITILYGTILKFMLKNVLNKDTSIDNKINRFISLVLVVILIISNIKGECMRSGSILLVSIFIKLILIDKDLRIEKVKI